MSIRTFFLFKKKEKRLRNKAFGSKIFMDKMRNFFVHVLSITLNFVPKCNRYTPEQLKVIMETGSAEVPYTSDFVSVKEPTERDTALRPLKKEADIKMGDFVLLSYGRIATYGTFTSVLKRSNMTSWELSENVLETKLGTNNSNVRVYHLYNEEEYNRFMKDLRKIRKLRERKIFMKG